MTPCDDLVAKAIDLEQNRMVSVGAKAALALALKPLCDARTHLTETHARMVRVSEELASLLAGNHQTLEEQTFDAPHYSKVTVCGAAARYRTAYTTLQEAVIQAEAAIAEHQRDLGRARAA